MTSVSCRPAYEKLLKVLQQQGVPTMHLQLADQHPHRTPPAPPLHPPSTFTVPAPHPAAGVDQRPRTVHGRPPTAPPHDPHRTTHTSHGRPQQRHEVATEGGVLGGVQGGSAAQAGSAAAVVKTEEQDRGGLNRQQVYAHNVPFRTIASIQPVSFLDGSVVADIFRLST